MKIILNEQDKKNFLLAMQLADVLNKDTTIITRKYEDGDYLTIAMTDAASIALMHARIKLDEQSTIENNYKLSFVVKDLMKIAKTMPRDIMLTISSDCSKLIITSYPDMKKKFILPLLSENFFNYNELPAIEWKGLATLSLENLKEVITESSLISDDMTFSNKGSELYVSTSGDLSKYESLLECKEFKLDGEIFDKKINNRFELSRLSKILTIIQKEFDDCVLQLGEYVPMLMACKNDAFDFKYMLAPRKNDDI